MSLPPLLSSVAKPRALLAAALLATVLAHPTATQAQAAAVGQIHGVVTVDDDGRGPTPLSYALVRLLPAGREYAVRSALTDAAGVFRFTDVPRGHYRLRLDRIGYAPDEGQTFEVVAGQIAPQRIEARARPLALEPLVVRPPSACHTARRLSRDPRLAALWQEAQKGAEARALLERQFALRYHLRQVTVTEPRGDDAVRHDTLLSLIQTDPSNPADRESLTRRRARGLWLRLPSEQELLDEAFLRDHCVETWPERRDGAWELRFRPVRTRRNRVSLRGSIFVDTATYQVRGLHLEYLHGSDPFVRTELSYADVPLPGGLLRLPVDGLFTATPTRAVRLDAASVRGALRFEGYELVQAP